VEEAERELRAGVSLNPYWIEGKLDLAELLAQANGKEARIVAADAERTSRKLMSRRPLDPRGPYTLCRALQLQGRIEEAQAAALLAEELHTETMETDGGDLHSTSPPGPPALPRGAATGPVVQPDLDADHASHI
jgi:predicted Zn-dependent protease